MAGVIQVGGLASGLDTNSIIDKLVAIERRPVDLLQNELVAAQDTRTSIDTFTKKLAVLREAAAALKDPQDVLVRKASSSNGTILSATAGRGAAPGSARFNIESLARVSIAGASVGVASGDAKIANGAGTLRFQVGTGDVVSLDVTDQTSLTDLVGAINDKKAGVTATAVNLGTSASPNYRLQLVSQTTGASQTISILQDDTSLGLATSQTGSNARFSLEGFTGTFERESNTFADVLPGVTVSLLNTGTADVQVTNDNEAINAKAQALSKAFSELVSYVGSQTSVTKSSDGEDVFLGSLATDTTIRRVLQTLHDQISNAVPGTSNFTNLSSLGFATQKDGTINFDSATFSAALGEDADALAAVFAGAGDTDGVADRLLDMIDDLQKAGGVIDARTKGLDQDTRRIQTDIEVGTRNVDAVKVQLQQQFAALESLVSTLQQQGTYITNALKG